MHSKAKSTRETVIQILSARWPLSARKIHSICRKEYGMGISYQAVHKALIQIVQDEIIEKRNNKYQLRPEWISNMHKRFKEIEARYSGNEHPFCGREIDSKNIKFLVFKSIFDLDHFNLSLLKNRKKAEAYTQSQHFWWSLFHLNEEPKLHIPNINKIYSLCKGNSFVDMLAMENEKGMNFNIKHDDFRHNHDVFVVDNNVVFMFYPKEFLETIERLYSKRDVLDSSFFDEFRKTFEKERDIFVFSINNQKFAAEMRKVISDAFRQ